MPDRELPQETLKGKKTKKNKKNNTRRLDMGHERENPWKPKMKTRVGYSKTYHTSGVHCKLREEMRFTGNCGKK